MINYVLAQLNPSATTLTPLYMVGSSTISVLRNLTVANAGGTSATWRLSIAPGGASNNISQYLYYDVAIAANSTFQSTLNLTIINPTDVVRIYASTANLTFSINVQENT